VSRLPPESASEETLILEPRVTVVVTPRERFSCAHRSLASIRSGTTMPHRLLYVDAGAPTPVRRYLERERRRGGLELLRANAPLPPNSARNLALREVDTEYVALVENDVLFCRGWLEPLVRCADETGAWVVGPLYLAGEPEAGVIHMAGGELSIFEADGKRRLHDEDRLGGARLADVEGQLERAPTEHLEFHAVLVRTDAFRHLGALDERLLCVREHEDFCLSVMAAGGQLYMEPEARVAFQPPPPVTVWDAGFFLRRWSPSWVESSLDHFHRKWRLDVQLDDPGLSWMWERRRLVLRQFRRRVGIRSVLGPFPEINAPSGRPGGTRAS